MFLDRDGVVSWVLKELHALACSHAQCCMQVFKYILQYLRAKRLCCLGCQSCRRR